MRCIVRIRIISPLDYDHFELTGKKKAAFTVSSRTKCGLSLEILGALRIIISSQTQFRR